MSANGFNLLINLSLYSSTSLSSDLNFFSTLHFSTSSFISVNILLDLELTNEEPKLIKITPLVLAINSIISSLKFLSKPGVKTLGEE